MREHAIVILGHAAHSVTFLTADMCLTADPGVASLIQARSHTFLEIDHERFVSYKRKYVHKGLVNCLVKLAQEKVWLGELIVPS